MWENIYDVGNKDGNNIQNINISSGKNGNAIVTWYSNEELLRVNNFYGDNQTWGEKT